MSVYGYTRKNQPVPLIQQLTDIQQYNCDEIYVEEAPLRDDREFQRLVAEMLGEGDSLVVESLLVFGKNLKQLAPILADFEARDIRLVCVSEEIDTKQANLSFYQLVAHLDAVDRYYRENVTQKAREELAEKGLVQGRPGITPEKVAQIHFLRQEKGYSVRKIAEECRISVGTVHKYLKVQQGSEKRAKY